MKAFNYNGQRNVSGERIRQERTRQRCTQSDLAARIQVSGVILERDCISRIENGLRMVQDFELRAIAEALGVTTDWLLEAEENNFAVGFLAYGNYVFRTHELLIFRVILC